MDSSTLSGASTDEAVETRDIVETQRPWNVVVWDDPVTPMTVVVVIFKRIFGYADSRATQLMLTVHHEGRAIVWSGQRERAESYCVKIQVAGLQCTIEQDE
ncbi:MAG TPA: ATP-dependent Clp protease adapter ClpS [Acidimicrobiales bacterium]|nr:ATP-dependent Clp protease adapter ClpS [Acidimicrobiales bacterium]